ncbi:DsrE family protein [Sulfoacidibacillus thermotolerans]|uniref:Uncharacterized protein n=1 Tax=Sulfoacidibacillus thermotolerans TaxID=1765684 RepID=A0A2U3D682_SULT2|nr:DsrE family protein [Sulfoacidibacillus thermotolerans]PWI56785.1 hypothetical protein BM613_11940 [Sulfoacidibacillus thermotolerans]
MNESENRRNSQMGIMVVSKQEDRVKVALSLALHIQEAPAEESIDHLEVYLFAEATELLRNGSDEIKGMIRELIARGIMVGACKNLVSAYGVEEEAQNLQVQVFGANATFARWAKEQYVTLSF